MKMRLFSLLTVAMLLLSSALPAAPTAVDFYPHPPRHAILDAEKPLLLIQDGIANLEIVVAPELPRQVKTTAAGELKTFLEKLWRQHPGGAAAQRREGQPGSGTDLPDPRPRCRCSGYARDAFVIKAFGNIIVLAGQDDKRATGWSMQRGTTFAVYESLERFLSPLLFSWRAGHHRAPTPHLEHPFPGYPRTAGLSCPQAQQ